MRDTVHYIHRKRGSNRSAEKNNEALHNLYSSPNTGCGRETGEYKNKTIINSNTVFTKL
jgi:hypothetical protein